MNDYTPEFLERVKRDYQAEQSQLDWESYLAGYWAAVKRFGSGRQSRKGKTND